MSDEITPPVPVPAPAAPPPPVPTASAPVPPPAPKPGKRANPAIRSAPPAPSSTVSPDEEDDVERNADGHIPGGDVSMDAVTAYLLKNRVKRN